MKKNSSNITIQNIKGAFKLDLPGERSHKRMLPEGRSLSIPPELGMVKESAVLVFLFLKDNELHFCLTRRNSNMKHHPGQISFPGGRCEEYENSFTETALRELEEETGVDKRKVEIIGQLSDLYISVSNFLIHPVVGFLNFEPDIKIDTHEVDELIIIPLQSFFDKKNVTFKMIETSSETINVPCYKIGNLVIWGATAMIISEFTELLTEYFQQKVNY